MKQIANRESINKVLSAMPVLKSRLSLDRGFTKDEYDLIAVGVIPHGMDEKWLIFLEEDNLHFHRSWTGKCIYQLRLEKRGDNFIVSDAWVNRDPVEYKITDEDYDVALISFLIDNFLLGEKTPFPLPGDGARNFPKGAYQHHISGSGYPEVIVPEKSSDQEKS